MTFKFYATLQSMYEKEVSKAKQQLLQDMLATIVKAQLDFCCCLFNDSTVNPFSKLAYNHQDDPYKQREAFVKFLKGKLESGAFDDKERIFVQSIIENLSLSVAGAELSAASLLQMQKHIRASGFHAIARCLWVQIHLGVDPSRIPVYPYSTIEKVLAQSDSGDFSAVKEAIINLVTPIIEANYEAQERNVHYNYIEENIERLKELCSNEKFLVTEKGIAFKHRHIKYQEALRVRSEKLNPYSPTIQRNPELASIHAMLTDACNEVFGVINAKIERGEEYSAEALFQNAIDRCLNRASRKSDEAMIYQCVKDLTDVVKVEYRDVKDDENYFQYLSKCVE